MIACDSPAATSSRYIRSAMAKMCGGSEPIGRFRHCWIEVGGGGGEAEGVGGGRRGGCAAWRGEGKGARRGGGAAAAAAAFERTFFSP